MKNNIKEKIATDNRFMAAIYEKKQKQICKYH